MRLRDLALGLCLAIVCARELPSARACPYCKADAAGLSASDPLSADDADWLPVMVSGGVDFASSYYFRGYLQADHGTIMQPYLNVFTTHRFQDDLVVSPYVSLFNSTHFAANNPMADMSDVMVGAVASRRGFAIDSRYAYYTMNPMVRTPVHEIGAKFSYDLINLWDDSDAVKPFSVRPYVGVYGEFMPDLDTTQLYANVGIEPSWRVELAGTKIGLGIPIEWGLGSNGYYFNSDGSNAAYGYFSSGLTASVALPVPEAYGKWFVNTSVQYLHLAADSVQMAGEGRNDVCIAKVGVSFVY